MSSPRADCAQRACSTTSLPGGRTRRRRTSMSARRCSRRRFCRRAKRGACRRAVGRRTQSRPWINHTSSATSPSRSPTRSAVLATPAQLDAERAVGGRGAVGGGSVLTSPRSFYRPMRDGARVLQVDENPLDGAGEQPAGAAHAALRRLAAGMHTPPARGCSHRPPPRRGSRAFAVPAADGAVAAAAATAGARDAAAGRSRRLPRKRRSGAPRMPPARPWPSQLVEAPPPSRLSRRRRPAVVCPRRRAPRGGRRPPWLPARPTEQGLTALSARGALLLRDTSPTRTFLLTVRVSNTKTILQIREGRAGSSAVNYARLDAELTPSRQRALELPRRARAAAQRPGGRAARPLGGCRISSINDFYDDAPGLFHTPRAALAHLATPWASRAAIQLAELVTYRPPRRTGEGDSRAGCRLERRTFSRRRRRRRRGHARR